MSYILDALRRADSQRRRGQVPSLDAQPPLATLRERRRAHMSPLIWLGIVVAVAAMLALAWRVVRAPGPDVARVAAMDPRSAASAPVLPPPVTAAPPTPSAQPSAVPSAVPPDAPPATVSPVPPPAFTPTSPATAMPRFPSAAVAGRGLQGSPGAGLANPRARRNAAPEDPGAAPADAASSDASTGAAAPGAAPRPAPPDRVLSITELPQDVRAQLPAVNVAGSVYAENPAARLLMVNGQLLREGDSIAPQLVLLQIQPKSAVLQFRNYRYLLNF